MKKIFLTTLMIAAFMLLSTSKIHAQVLFQDNFESGNANQWTEISGHGIWQVSDVNGSKRYGGIIHDTNTIIDAVAGDNNWTDYVFEMDLLAKQGVDKNIRLRWRDDLGQFTYGYHFNPILHTSGGTDTSFALNNNQVYHIKVVMQGTHFQLYVDNVKQSDDLLPTASLNGKIGLTISTGSASPTEVWFDNIVVTSLDDSLAVPLLKQTDPAWGNQVYDGANIWSPITPGITTWGCALTSAAMVFKFDGITKLPGGINLDPGTLNNWLKGQSDGYVSNGLVNWLALSRLSKLAKSINPAFTKDALEYTRTGGSNTSQLTADFSNGIPDILEEPGHYIVEKGPNNSTFEINDPYYDRQDLTPYGNTFLSSGRFTPTNSDLSYIMAVVDSSVNLDLRDDSNNSVGESFTQSPLSSDGGTGNSGSPLKILYFPKPNTGNYTLNLSAPAGKNYQLKLYLYDKDGNVKVVGGVGIVGPGDSDSYLIQFNHGTSNSDTSKQNTTFDSFISDINSLCSNHEINLANCASLVVEAKTAQNLSKSNKTKIGAIALLKAVDTQINLGKNKGITVNAYNILHADIQVIIASL